MNESLSQRISHYQQRINGYLSQELDQLPQHEPQLLAAMRHGLLLGGKRIRPLLVYLVGELSNTSPEKLDALAAAIEAIHAYSLIHDDLPAMDNDDLRRGKPTCHRAFEFEKLCVNFCYLFLGCMSNFFLVYADQPDFYVRRWDLISDRKASILFLFDFFDFSSFLGID